MNLLYVKYWQLNGFIGVTDGVICKWCNIKDRKDNKQCYHYSIVANQQSFPQERFLPRYTLKLCIQMCPIVSRIPQLLFLLETVTSITNLREPPGMSTTKLYLLGRCNIIKSKKDATLEWMDTKGSCIYFSGRSKQVLQTETVVCSLPILLLTQST